MIVDELADVRAGDKGSTLILAVLPRTDAGWHLLREQLTVQLVGQHFAIPSTVEILRTELPTMPALVFRLPGVLGGGVTNGTHLDGHGKTLSYHLLSLELPDV